MQVFAHKVYYLMLDEGESSSQAVAEFNVRHPFAEVLSFDVSGYIQVPGTDYKRNCVTLHVWDREVGS